MWHTKCNSIWYCGLLTLLGMFNSRMFVAGGASYLRPVLPGSQYITGEKQFHLSKIVPEFVSDEVREEYQPNERQDQEDFYGIRSQTFIDDTGGQEQIQIKHSGKELNIKEPAVLLENQCGVKVEEYFKSIDPNDSNLNNFCHDSIKQRNSEQNRFLKEEINEGTKKCYALLCAWYKEKCEKTVLMEHSIHRSFSGTTHEDFVLDPTLQKCNCFYRIWSQCGCANTLNIKDKINNISQLNVNSFKSNGKEINIAKDKNDEMNEYQNDESSIASRSGFADGSSLDADSVVFFGDDDSTQASWQRPKPTRKPTTKVDEIDLNNFEANQRKCFAKKQVWFGGDCHVLTSETACDEPGTWLVIEKPADDDDAIGNLNPVCESKKCSDEDEVWWSATNECVKKTDVKKRFCKGRDIYVTVDSFGDGYCTCHEGFGKLENSEDCYEYYQQGPCASNEIMSYNLSTGFAVCSIDRCLSMNNPKAGSRKQKRESNDQHHVGRYGDTNVQKIGNNPATQQNTRNKREKRLNLSARKQTFDVENEIYPFAKELRDPYKFVKWEDEFQRSDRVIRQAKIQRKIKKLYAPLDGNGVCYKIGLVGPCEGLGENYRFVFHRVLKVPSCYDSAFELHLIDSRPTCKVDESNNCREEVKLAQTSELDFLISLKNQARRKRDVRPK